MQGGRLYTLDTMRGVAATLVMLYHLGFLAAQYAPGGYLAVDFFFVLSGFVLSRAFTSRLRGEQRPASFLRDRFIRLYPMFLLGVIFALVNVTLGEIAEPDRSMPATHLVVALLSNVLLLPSATGTDLFPLNGPAWSLFFEFAVNAAFAVALVRTGIRGLIVTATVAAVLILISASVNGSLSVGWTWATAWGGAARAVYGFTVGIILDRVIVARTRVSVAATLPPIGLAAMLLAPVDASVRPFFDVVSVLLISPLLVVLGARWQSPRSLAAASRGLGALAYPLYAIHYPLIITAALVSGTVDLPPAVWLPCSVALLLILSLLLGRYVDPPARRWMAGKLKLTPEAVQDAPASARSAKASIDAD